MIRYFQFIRIISNGDELRCERQMDIDDDADERFDQVIEERWFVNDVQVNKDQLNVSFIILDEDHDWEEFWPDEEWDAVDLG